MTIQEAIQEVRRVGSIRVENGKLKLRFPEPERARLEIASDALRRNRQAALEAVSDAAAIPPLTRWPESLRDLAREHATASGDHEAARREVWLSWAQWKAQTLNRLFQGQGLTGQPGRITAATVQPALCRISRSLRARERATE
jgi:hypothetical protein